MKTGYIYVIRARDLDHGEDFYIGSCYDLIARERQHKSASLVEEPNLLLYKVIKENGGWNKYVMYSIFESFFSDDAEIDNIEAKFIEMYKPKLNANQVATDLKKDFAYHRLMGIKHENKKHMDEPKQMRITDKIFRDALNLMGL